MRAEKSGRQGHERRPERGEGRDDSDLQRAEAKRDQIDRQQHRDEAVPKSRTARAAFAPFECVELVERP